MKRVLFFVVIFFSLGILGNATEVTEETTPTTDAIVGSWMGTLKFSGMELTVVFHISKEADKTLHATIDSPDQGATGIVVDHITFENGHVVMESKAILGKFEGDLQSDNETIEGKWSQSGMTLPLTLKRTEHLPTPNRPQEPKPPFPYRTEEVTYENKEAGVTLAGTLTLPQREPPFPAVLLITGSGPQDRDETIFGHKPFLVLADYLTRHGIAVLRADDRGVGKSTGDFSTATTKDFAGDVQAGVDYLKSREEIDPSHIGLIGHSEGGIIAPMVAAERDDIAFIVLMAGPALPGDKLLTLQAKYGLKAEGVSDSMVSWNRNLQQRWFDVLKQESDTAVMRRKLNDILNELTAELDDRQKQELGITDEKMQQEIQKTLSPWFRYFVTYDPLPTLKKVRCPVLALYSEKDLQVPAKENIRAIEKEILASHTNKRFTVKELPNLNHLFQTAQTGAFSEYARIEETISPQALATIDSWIHEILKNEKQ